MIKQIKRRVLPHPIYALTNRITMKNNQWKSNQLFNQNEEKRWPLANYKSWNFLHIPWLGHPQPTQMEAIGDYFQRGNSWWCARNTFKRLAPKSPIWLPKEVHDQKRAKSKLYGLLLRFCLITRDTFRIWRRAIVCRISCTRSFI